MIKKVTKANPFTLEQEVVEMDTDSEEYKFFEKSEKLHQEFKEKHGDTWLLAETIRDFLKTKNIELYESSILMNPFSGDLLIAVKSYNGQQYAIEIKNTQKTDNPLKKLAPDQGSKAADAS
jgi:hypothetical protein